MTVHFYKFTTVKKLLKWADTVLISKVSNFSSTKNWHMFVTHTHTHQIHPVQHTFSPQKPGGFRQTCMLLGTKISPVTWEDTWPVGSPGSHSTGNLATGGSPWLVAGLVLFWGLLRWLHPGSRDQVVKPHRGTVEALAIVEPILHSLCRVG